MEYKSLLLDIGLTNNEAEIYLILLKLNEATASQISGKTKISRPNIYDSINKLIIKGMISYITKNGMKYFKSTNPIKILEYLREKELKLKEKERTIQQILPELSSFMQPLKEKPSVEVFEGAEGLKMLLNDILKTGKDIIGWGATDKINDFLPEWTIERYIKDKAKKGIKTRQLYVEGDKPLSWGGYTNKKVSKDFSAPVTYGAYGDRIMITFWSETPIVIRVISHDIANSFKKHFEDLWKKTKP